MAYNIKHAESFTGPSTITQLGYTLPASAPSIISGKAYMFQSDKFIQAGVGSLSQTCVNVKWRCQNPTRPVGDHWVVSYYGTANTRATPIAGLLARDDGSFEVWQRQSGHVTMFAATAAGVWNLSTDYTIEFRYSGSGSALGGYTFKVWQGTTLVASLTASAIVTTYSATINSWLLGPADTGTPFDINDYFWDVVITSISSTSLSADMIGPTTFYQLHPTADGSQIDYTPNTGANWAAVDEAVVDLDATFNFINTSGTGRDSYVMSDLPGTAPPIAAVTPHMCIRALNNGTWLAHAEILISGTYYTVGGTTFGIGALTTPSYSYYGNTPQTLSPAGFVPWSAAVLNAAESGMTSTLTAGTPTTGAHLSQFYLEVVCAGTPAVSLPGYALIVG